MNRVSENFGHLLRNLTPHFCRFSVAPSQISSDEGSCLRPSRWQTFYNKRHPTEPSPARLLLQVSLTRPECGVGWGMSLVDDTEEEVRQRGGVPVSAVAPGGPADAAGVAAGDVISHVRRRTEGVGTACTA